jgi:DNA-damage-inducible protein D
MSKEIKNTTGGHISPFERIKRASDAGVEYWSSRDFAEVLGYGDYRNFEGVIEKAKLSCFNSGHRIEDHFVDVTEMIEIGKGGQRPVKTVLLSRYACYLAIQNADPKKEIVAQGQTYFAIQTRRQELGDERIEEERRLLLREEMRRHNVQLADAAKGGCLRQGGSRARADVAAKAVVAR